MDRLVLHTLPHSFFYKVKLDGYADFFSQLHSSTLKETEIILLSFFLCTFNFTHLTIPRHGEKISSTVLQSLTEKKKKVDISVMSVKCLSVEQREHYSLLLNSQVHYCCSFENLVVFCPWSPLGWMILFHRLLGFLSHSFSVNYLGFRESHLVATTFLVTTADAHDFMYEEDLAHFWALVLAFTDRGPVKVQPKFSGKGYVSLWPVNYLMCCC